MKLKKFFKNRDQKKLGETLRSRSMKMKGDLNMKNGLKSKNVKYQKLN